MIGVSITQLAITAGALLAVGYVLLGTMAVLPATRDLGRDLLRTYVTATLILAIILVGFLVEGWLLTALLIAMAFRVAYEAGHVRLGPDRAVATGLAVALAAGFGALLPTASLVWGLAPLWLVSLGRLITAPKEVSGPLWGIVDLLVFPVLPLILFVNAATSTEFAVLMLATYILVETFDSYALLSGKAMGRTPAFPRLSPRKTVEGLLGGAVMLIVTTAAVSLFIDLPFSFAVIGALLIGVLTLSGDLSASRLKRNAGVKDYPIVMARQGGVFDSVDSWIAAGAGLTVVITIVQSLA